MDNRKRTFTVDRSSVLFTFWLGKPSEFKQFPPAAIWGQQKCVFCYGIQCGFNHHLYADDAYVYSEGPRRRCISNFVYCGAMGELRVVYIFAF